MFGAIATVEPELMQKRLQPLIEYLEKITERSIVFETGYDYHNTIEKFADGSYDLGFIGPAPYIRANEHNPKALKISAGLESSGKGYFHSLIVSKKDSAIVKLEDLKNRRFAFGSPESTLSYYVPMQMLRDAGIIEYLDRYDFLGRHDRVAQYVIMGKYDAGAIKESVAKKYDKYLQVIAKSEPIPDFMIVVSSKMPLALAQKIQSALFSLKDPEILHAIKASATGFAKREDSDYDHLRAIMKQVSLDE